MSGAQIAFRRQICFDYQSIQSDETRRDKRNPHVTFDFHILGECWEKGPIRQWISLFIWSLFPALTLCSSYVMQGKASPNHLSNIFNILILYKNLKHIIIDLAYGGQPTVNILLNLIEFIIVNNLS